MISAVGHLVLEAVIIVTSLCILSLRIYMNLRTPGGRVRALVISDWLLISAQLIGALFVVYQIWKNVTLMRANNPTLIISEGQLKSVLAAATVYVTILWLIKASFIAFYWSLHVHLTKTLKKLLYFSMVYLSSSFLAMNLLNFLWCRPLSRMFKFTLTNFCNIGIDFHTGTIFFVLNVSSDLIVMAIGLMFVYNLRRSLGPRQWIAAAFVFTVGSIPIVASTVRYSTIYSIIREPLSAFSRFADIEAWSEIDCAFATYAACLPALRRLIRKRRTGNFGTQESSVFWRRKRQRRGNIVWLRGTQLEGSLDEDVERGHWGSGELFNPSALVEPMRAHGGVRSTRALDIYVTTEFDVAADERLGVPRQPMRSAMGQQYGIEIGVGSAPGENHNQPYTSPRIHSPQPLRPEPCTKPLRDAEDEAAGSDVELKKLEIRPSLAREGSITPATMNSEPQSRSSTALGVYSPSEGDTQAIQVHEGYPDGTGMDFHHDNRTRSGGIQRIEATRTRRTSWILSRRS